MNQSIMKCCICNSEHAGEFITINYKKYHLCCIEQLQQENEELKRVYDNLQKENEILKNNNKTFFIHKEEAYRIADEEYKENQLLKDKIEKAIDYINKIELDNYDIYTANILLDRNDDLLEILEDKEVSE